MGPFSDNGGRHRIVASNANTEQETESKQPPHLRHTIGQPSAALGREGDDHDYSNNGDHQFLSVYKLATKCITQKSKRDLANDIADVSCGIDGATDQKRNGGGWNGAGAVEVAGGEELVRPDWGSQIDDKKVVRVEHKPYAADEVKFEVSPCEGLWGVAPFIFFEGQDLAILVFASIGMFFPDGHDFNWRGRISVNDLCQVFEDHDCSGTKSQALALFIP